MSDQPLRGMTGVVVGVANKRSIAWAIAKAWADAGATLIFSYQGERLKGKVEALLETLDQEGHLFPCDVTKDEEIDAFFKEVEAISPKIDMVLHSVAYAPREALEGRFLDTPRAAYAMAHDISAFSLVALCQRAAPMMPDGGSVIAMSFYGAEKVVPHYNVMGVAKASLEATTRYLAYDLGSHNIRVNCISAGPMQTLAARGIAGFSSMLGIYEDKAPLGRSCTAEELGATGVFLAGPGGGSITGQVLYVDGGYQIMGM